MKKVPVSIVTGPLGSGKSTFISFLLKQAGKEGYPRKFAIIENEFGNKTGLESSMFFDQRSDEENRQDSFKFDYMELPNGCICCQAKDFFVLTLENMLKKFKDVDYVIVETSGLADPGKLIEILWLDAELESSCYLDGVITLLDSFHFGSPTSSSSSTEAKSEFERQILFANRILLNKSDLVDSNILTQLKSQIQSLNVWAQVYPSQKDHFEDVAPFVLGLDAFNAEISSETISSSELQSKRELALSPFFHTFGQNVHAFECEVKDKEVSDPSSVESWLGELLWSEENMESNSILRIKGTFHSQGYLYLVQGVYQQFEVIQRRLHPITSPIENRLVFITHSSISSHSIQSQFNELF